MEPLECRHPMGSDQVVTAPAVFRLERHSIMTARLQFAQDATEEMRIAVVPIGHKRMSIQNEAHAALPDACQGRRMCSEGRGIHPSHSIHLSIGRK